jgi:glycosyltransferase involved in cell wall biosynthesis
MNILQIGIFKDHELGGCRVFNAGLKENNCNVIEYDYRSNYQKGGEAKINNDILELSNNCDLVFIGKGELLSVELLKELKRKKLITSLWYGDVRTEPEQWLQKLLPNIDFFFMSSGGELLRRYHAICKPKVSAYYFNPSQPSIVEKYSKTDIKKSGIVFVGTDHHACNQYRKNIVKYLSSRGDVDVYGGADKPNPPLVKRILNRIFNRESMIRGEKYIRAIKKAKVGIGINAIQNIDKYTSDRLTHFVEFGCFYLTNTIPGFEKIFKIGSEIVFYDNTDDLAAKINKYYSESSEREYIAANAQRRMLNEYNSKNIVKMMLDIIENGRSNRFEFVETYK